MEHFLDEQGSSFKSLLHKAREQSHDWGSHARRTLLALNVPVRAEAGSHWLIPRQKDLLLFN